MHPFLRPLFHATVNTRSFSERPAPQTAIWFPHCPNAAKCCRIHTWSYRVLRQRAYQVAVALRAAGHGQGCRVAIIGAMTPEAVAAYLAVVLVGGAVVSVADSFSPEEMSVRLKVAQATLIIVQVCHILDREDALLLQPAAMACCWKCTNTWTVLPNSALGRDTLPNLVEWSAAPGCLSMVHFLDHCFGSQ